MGFSGNQRVSSKANSPRHSGKHRRFQIEPLEPRQMLTGVVINEIHVDPDLSTEKVEFIELHNDSSLSIDLSGWVIDDAVDFVFPAGSTISAFDYVVIAQDASDFQSKFGFAPDGQWEVGDKLSNSGELIQLRDSTGQLVDSVDYQLGFPWPTVGEIGRSMELIHPSLDNDLSGSWRASGGGDIQEEVKFLERGDANWSYRKGTSEASSPIDAWRMPGFVEDNTWVTGETPIGYGDGDDNTILNDMRNGYTSVFLRNTFEISGSIPNSLKLGVYSDDGAVVWINGTRVGFFHVNDQELSFDDTAFNHEAVWEEVTIPLASQFLVEGENTIAVQGFNQSLTSSDFSIDVEVSLPPVEAGIAPTPGGQNAALSPTAPPQMRQVSHTPEQPQTGEDVVISMKVTDPDGVSAVSLDYQVVNPGAYIRITDPSYETNWTSIVMNDMGSNGDAVAGDDVYTATIPGNVNQHRRVVRYRVAATDSLGSSVQVPYSDDPQPNFAYFVYNGVPDYTASLRPGVSSNVTYSGDRLDDIATYHLIANSSDVDNSQYNGSFNGVQFRGTLVYDGQVYDHIEFRNRGQGSTYQVGKNKWKLNFNRGHSFKARDSYGNRYEEDWDKLNILPGTNPWWRNDVSTEGTVLFEPVAFRLYELAGTPAPHTQHFQFRVIDSANEAPSNQYQGDFWGLYVGIEQPDGRFLKERGLPDGNLFNMHGGTGGSTSQRNQGSELPTDRSDLSAFISGVNGGFQSEQQWTSNLNLDSYFAWNMSNHVSNNSDIRVHENVNYYHNQETGQWYTVPWDMDLTFEDRPHHSIPVTNRENIRRVLGVPSIQLAYENRLREYTDLLLDSGDAAALVEEYALRLTVDGTDLTITDSNQAQWDYHPRKNKKGIWYDNFNSSLLPSRDFAGLVEYMQDFMSPGGYGYNLLQSQGDDSGIPNQPTVSYTGNLLYARDDLSFQTSNFSDPQGAGTFESMEWRVAEVHNSDVANYDPTQPYKYEIENAWESGEITTFDNEFVVPESVIDVGKTYRVRVRMQDSAGHWSHWSDAHEFQVTPGAEPVGQEIIIVEVNYNPADPTAAELANGFTDKDDFEFIELINTGSEVVSLGDLTLEQTDGDGVSFDFSTGAVEDLAPGERVVVVEDLDAFIYRYGTSLPVAGQWTGGLGNSAEIITLAVGGVTHQEFVYNDDWYPSTDNGGHTLQLVDATNTDVASWEDPTLWQASEQALGTPGNTNIQADFNGDGAVDATDIDMLCVEIGLARNWVTFDIVPDTLVTSVDLDVLVVGILGSAYGDANLDGVVDVSDFNLWNSNKFLSGRGWAGADFNCDGVTDVSDFNLWNTNKFSQPGLAFRSDTPHPHGSSTDNLRRSDGSPLAMETVPVVRERIADGLFIYAPDDVYHWEESGRRARRLMSEVLFDEPRIQELDVAFREL